MSSLTQLAEEILANAKRLDSYTSSNNLPPASFDHDSFSDLPPDLQGIRSTVIDSAQTVRKLVLGPTGLATEILHSVSGPTPALLFMLMTSPLPNSQPTSPTYA